MIVRRGGTWFVFNRSPPVQGVDYGRIVAALLHRYTTAVVKCRLYLWSERQAAGMLAARRGANSRLLAMRPAMAPKTLLSQSGDSQLRKSTHAVD